MSRNLSAASVAVLTMLVVTASFVPLTVVADGGGSVSQARLLAGGGDPGGDQPVDPPDTSARERGANSGGSGESSGNGEGRGNGPAKTAAPNGGADGGGPPAGTGDGGKSTTEEPPAHDETSGNGDGQTDSRNRGSNGRSGNSGTARSTNSGGGNSESAPTEGASGEAPGRSSDAQPAEPSGEAGAREEDSAATSGSESTPATARNGTTPANASNTTVRGPPTALGRGDDYPAYVLDRSAFEFRELALAELRSRNLRGNGDRLLVALNGTRETHLDSNRVRTGVVFEADGVVAAGSRGRAPNVTGYVVAADAVLARAAIDDAERVATTLDARNVSYNRSAVDARLEAARAARERGNRLRGRAVGAVQQYRKAWGHAQRAIDRMDEATTPTVEVGPRTDRPHNTTVTRKLNGTVFDVRGYELTAALRVNGTTARTIALNTSTVPGTVGRYNTTTELARQWPDFESETVANRTYVLNVSVRDPGRDYAPTALDDLDPVHDPQLATGLLRLDGDGLTDRYEMRVTGTDPLDPDSDSNRTANDEGGNYTIDGAEDFDADGLITFRETQVGTDPLDPDTDGDNLTDGFETERRDLDALDHDTDDDGVVDGAEDPDGDGLPNLGEMENGTNILRPDTDGDGLKDTERADYGTDPLLVDTDGDGLTDASELRLGTDPLDHDTDDDGIVDGNETFTSTTRDPNTGVSVDVTGEGDVADGIVVRPASQNDSGETRRASIVKLNSRSAFDQATVTVPLTSSTDPDGDLAIYKWDPSTNTTWERQETTIDAANMTATATVDSFSYVTVYDISEYEELSTARIDVSWPAAERFDDLDGWSGDAHVEDGAAVLVSEAADTGDGGDNDDDSTDDDSTDDDSTDDDSTDDDTTDDDTTDDGGTTDSDGDGIRDSLDTCPNQAGTVFDGCPVDSDNDGIDDFYDECDSEPEDDDGYQDGDGCPEYGPDSDGDGVEDSEDLCPNTPGRSYQGCPFTRGSISQVAVLGAQQTAPADTTQQLGSVAATSFPTSAKLSRSLDLDGIETATVQVRASAEVGADGRAEVVVTDGSTTVTAFEASDSTGVTTVSADVSDLGADATVELRTEGDAELRVEAIRVERDADGDGIPFAVEEASDDIDVSVLTPNGFAVRKALNLGTETTDTDGDNATDDREVALNLRFLPDEDPTVSLVRYTSHPDYRNTDGSGLNDYEESLVGSNPKAVETVSVGVKFPTVGTFNESGRPVPVMNPTKDDIYDADHVTLSLANADKWNTLDAGWFSSRPACLQGVELEEQRDYYCLETKVYVGTSTHVGTHSRYNDDLPTNVRVTFPNSRITVVDSTLTTDGVDVEDGFARAELIVKQPTNDPAVNFPTRDDSNTVLSSVGSPEVAVTYEDDSVFARSRTFFEENGISSISVRTTGHERVVTHGGTQQYGVPFRPQRDLREDLEVGAERLGKLGTTFTVVSAGGTAAAFYITSESVAIASLPVILDIGITASGIPVGPVDTVRRAYTQSYSIFLDEERRGELQGDPSIIYPTVSGPDIVVTT